MSSDAHYRGGSSNQLPQADTGVPAEPAEIDSRAETEYDPSLADEIDPMIGQQIGRYRLVAKLGEGGMGSVYAAEHVSIHKRVAVKLLRPEITSNKEAVERFEREAQSASSIGHKNIIGIDDFGRLDDGRIFLFMELLDGQPLNEMLREPISADRLVNILIQTGHGLAAAHAKNIVHRDMKPENIFVTRGPDGSDVPKLLDFGIAKVSGNDGQNNLTRTGTIFGTPFYMSPEQALGQAVDHRADIYAMGVIMYEVFAGSVPYQGESFMGILTQHITAEPEPMRQRAAAAGRVLPAGIEHVVARAMKKDPAERYATMDELVQDLVKVYRSVAGAGMSSYMEAHVPPGMMSSAMPAAFPAGPQSAIGPVAHPPAPTPPPMVPGGPMPGPMSGQLSGHTPMPHRPHTGEQSGVYADQSFADIPVKKGRGGLIAAILIILAVAGGAAAFFIVSSQKKDEASASTETPPPRDPVPVKDPVVVPDGDDPTGDPVGTDTDPDPSKNDPDPTADPTADPDGDPAGDPTDVVEAPEPVIVLLATRPAGGVIFDADGKRIASAPHNIRIVPGEPRSFVIKRRGGYEDATVELDGSEKKVTVRLERKSGRKDPGKDSTRDPGKDPSKDPKDDTKDPTSGGKDGKDGTDKPPKDDKKDPDGYDPADILE